MGESADQFLEALRWHLRSLRLAGVRRVPRLFQQTAGQPASPATATAAPGGAAPRSWAEAARYLKNHIDTEADKWARTKAGGGDAPHGRAQAGSAPPRAAEARPAPEQEFDPALKPAEPVDPATAEQLAELDREVAGCTRCKELVASRTQTVFCDGPPNADLMFIGEAPGEEEDRQGVAFVGRAGHLLTKIITGGMKMHRRDVYICNILKCRPPGNRNPLPQEAANCRPYLDRQIELLRPKIICCLGGVASRFLLDDPTAVGKMRGRWHEYRGIPVRVAYHPAYLLRNYTADARQKVWDDVLKVVERLKALRDTPGGPRQPTTELF